MEAAARLHVPADYLDAQAGVCGGRRFIRGTRVKVSEIVSRHVYLGESLDEIVEALPPLTLAQVHAALAYYYDNHDEIEAELRAQDDFVSALARKHAPHLAGT